MVSPSTGGLRPSVYIEFHLFGKSNEREGWLMSDFEIISVILMMISIIVTILLAYIENTKK